MTSWMREIRIVCFVANKIKKKKNGALDGATSPLDIPVFHQHTLHHYFFGQSTPISSTKYNTDQATDFNFKIYPNKYPAEI